MKDTPKVELITIQLNQFEEMFEKLISKYLSNPPPSNIVKLEGRMNQKEAAEFIGRSEATMVKYKKAGLLPSHIIPGTNFIIYYKSELIEFMKRTPKLHRSVRK